MAIPPEASIILNILDEIVAKDVNMPIMGCEYFLLGQEGMLCLAVLM